MTSKTRKNTTTGKPTRQPPGKISRDSAHRRNNFSPPRKLPKINLSSLPILAPIPPTRPHQQPTNSRQNRRNWMSSRTFPRRREIHTQLPTFAIISAGKSDSGRQITQQIFCHPKPHRRFRLHRHRSRSNCQILQSRRSIE